MNQTILIRNVILSVATLLLAAAVSTAQPSLNFKRIVNNWPTIELYFTAGCNGQPLNALDKSNMEIVENGTQIPDFTIWCPDNQVRCAISAAMVFDASSSMQGAGNQGAIAAGNAFVDLLDGVTDQAAVVWFGSDVVVRQGMTTDTTALHDAIDALPAGGATACWDGIYVGISEVINSGDNPCRAVIAMTDGGDNASTHTPQDCIALANRNRIRIFTIGVGGVEPTNLELIALLTGGKYYQAPSPDQLTAIYQEISTILFSGFMECLITYQSSCMDGGLRTVDLILKNACNGSDTKTKTYRAPKDTSTFSRVDFTAGDEIADAGTDVLVPVWISGSTPTQFDKCTVIIGHDPALCTFVEVVLDGTMLEGTSVSFAPLQDAISVRTLQRIAANLSKPFIIMKYHVKDTASAGSVASVKIQGMAFDGGCFKPVLHDGSIRVWNSLRPHVVVQGSAIICSGGNVTLECSEGFSEYRWSTGDTTRSITVSSPGGYYVEARNSLGTIEISDNITVIVNIPVKPVIIPATPLIQCDGGTVLLDMQGDYVKQLWSTGSTSRYITVTKSGKYFVTGTDANGCKAVSDTVTIEFRTMQQPTINGPLSICDLGKEYIYSIDTVPNATYQWHAVAGSIISSQSNNARVKWIGGQTGTVTVTITDTVSGCSRGDTLNVSLNNPVTLLSPSSDMTLCAGDTVTVGTLVPHESYQWNTGATSRYIQVTQPGLYYCLLTNNNCTTSSDTVHVQLFDPASINVTGPVRICRGETGTYQVQYFGAAQYSWSVEGGAILSGGNTSSAVIRWESAPTGTMHVSMIAGSCNDTITRSVTIAENTPPSLNINGDTVLCEGDSLLLEAQSGYIVYSWSNGASGRTLEVRTTGSYYVEATNGEDCTSRSDTVTILFHPLPAKPLVIQSHDILICTTPADRYQWSESGQTIPGATNDTLVITGAGSYSVQIWNEYGCTNVSEPLIPVGIETVGSAMVQRFDLSPNPSNGEFTVSLEFQKPRSFTMRVVNTAGMTISTHRIHEPVMSYTGKIRLNNTPPGLYLLLVESGNESLIRKLIIQ